MKNHKTKYSFEIVNTFSGYRYFQMNPKQSSAGHTRRKQSKNLKETAIILKNERETEMRDLSMIIDMFFLDSQYGDPLGILWMMAVLILGNQTKSPVTFRLRDNNRKSEREKTKI